MKYYFKTIQSPVGQLKLVAGDNALVAVLWDHNKFAAAGVSDLSENNNHSLLLETEKQLDEYFKKKRTEFSLPLEFIGTEFQEKVWTALLTIPFGETRTYGQIAKQVGSPQAVRAVGGAANKNPIPIIAPCHRVVGGSGKLVGFGGGLVNKSFLLQMENPKSPTLF